MNVISEAEEVATRASDRSLVIAWAAGLFEGEGCWFASGNNIGAIVRMTDEDVVRRFHEIVEVGTVRYVMTPSMRLVACQPLWKWSVQNLAGVERVYVMFQPFLGERRKARGLACINRIRDRRGLGR